MVSPRTTKTTEELQQIVWSPRTYDQVEVGLKVEHSPQNYEK